MNICVLGTGYVGLVVGVCISDRGFSVTCVDVDENKIASLKRGEVPIYEPGLDEILKRSVDAGRLSFTTDGDSAIAKADIVYIAVGKGCSDRCFEGVVSPSGVPLANVLPSKRASLHSPAAWGCPGPFERSH